MTRVLVVRMSAIGDIVMASALIPALRRTWPEARLAWLTEPAGAALLRHNPRLDEVLVWPRGEWLQLRRERRFGELARAVWRFGRELRTRRFDLVLDAQGLLKSAVWARLTGAPRRIGLGSREGGQWLMTETLGRRTVSRRIGAEYRLLAEHLGLQHERHPVRRPLALHQALAALVQHDLAILPLRRRERVFHAPGPVVALAQDPRRRVHLVRGQLDRVRILLVGHGADPSRPCPRWQSPGH